MRLQLADGPRLAPLRTGRRLLSEDAETTSKFNNILQNVGTFLKKPETQNAIKTGATTAIGLVAKKKSTTGQTPRVSGLSPFISGVANVTDPEKIALRDRVQVLEKQNFNHRIIFGLGGLGVGLGVGYLLSKKF